MVLMWDRIFSNVSSICGRTWKRKPRIKGNINFHSFFQPDVHFYPCQHQEEDICRHVMNDYPCDRVRWGKQSFVGRSKSIFGVQWEPITICMWRWCGSLIVFKKAPTQPTPSKCSMVTNLIFKVKRMLNYQWQHCSKSFFVYIQIDCINIHEKFCLVDTDIYNRSIGRQGCQFSNPMYYKWISKSAMYLRKQM